jgi:hypothetical protein
MVPSIPEGPLSQSINWTENRPAGQFLHGNAIRATENISAHTEEKSVIALIEYASASPMDHCTKPEAVLRGRDSPT